MNRLQSAFSQIEADSMQRKDMVTERCNKELELLSLIYAACDAAPGKPRGEVMIELAESLTPLLDAAYGLTSITQRDRVLSPAFLKWVNHQLAERKAARGGRDV